MPTSGRLSSALANEPEVLRRAREVFLGSGTLLPGVRDVIAESWRRSSGSGVRPDHLPADFQPQGRADPQLLECVDTVLGEAIEQFSGESLSLIFAAPDGHVLRRYYTDRSFGRRLERVHLEPGVSYGEGAVGTNGIGTSLELAKPALVVGEEHFNENLAIFGCAAAPVRHPMTHALLGVVDLTTFADVANQLLLGLSSTLAGRIEMELQQQVGSRELALLRDYRAACRQGGGPVLAQNRDLFMFNPVTEQMLDIHDRIALLAQTSDVAELQQARTMVADLPSGTVARVDYRPSFTGVEFAGGVFRVQLIRPAETGSSGGGRAFELPELTGTSAEWTRAVTAMRQSCRDGVWVMVEGEHGVGKVALTRAVHASERSGQHFRQIDCSAAGLEPPAWLAAVEDELADSGTLLISHVEALPPELVESLASVLDAVPVSSAHDKWVVLTRGEATEEVDSALVPVCDRTVVVAPLRHRVEDVAALVPVIVRRLNRGADLTFAPRAMNLLQRNPWPENVDGLQEVLRKVVQRKRVGTIEPSDLPTECFAVGRRKLSPLEALERDAIVQALIDFDGNKNRAATHLGMSRATIYRKIRDFHIVWE